MEATESKHAGGSPANPGLIQTSLVTMKIGAKHYTLDVKRFPYLEAYLSFLRHSGRDIVNHLPTHPDLPFFDVALHGLNHGFRQVFDLMPPDISAYISLCDTLELIAPDLLGGLKLIDIFHCLRCGKAVLDEEGRVVRSANERVALTFASRLVYMFVVDEFESEHEDELRRRCDAKRAADLAFESTMWVLTHEKVFGWKVRRVVRDAFEERFVVTRKQLWRGRSFSLYPAELPESVRIRIGQTEHLVFLKRIPYIKAFVSWERHCGRFIGTEVLTHVEDIPFFGVINHCARYGLQNVFRRMPAAAGLDDYHTLCETMRFLCVEVLPPGLDDLATLVCGMSRSRRFNPSFLDSRPLMAEFIFDLDSGWRCPRSEARERVFRILYVLLMEDIEGCSPDNLFKGVESILQNPQIFDTSHTSIPRIIREAFEERVVITDEEREKLDKYEWARLGPRGSDDQDDSEDETDGSKDSDDEKGEASQRLRPVFVLNRYYTRGITY
ncbi:hypothetical protein GE09DRAFT_1182157 [Coniochaeta sp. 2T2.1]|nr:hypothetical protein GE09DRAFT_1182157 [Coniochaeta sp. 2T2.1]